VASVLVTGASRGIGRATALTLGRAGHKVFATMRSPERAPELGATAAEEGLAITVSAMDVDSDESVRVAVSQILEHGPLDALVNNAGIERRGSVEELDLAEFRAVMETNYFGALRCIQAVLPSMRIREQGCIVNVTSVAGKIVSSPLGPYAASKYALEAISEALAQEVKPFGIRVAIVEPGIIETDMAIEITRSDGDSVYPHERRMAGMFAASLEDPTGPEVVGEQIREIIEGDSWQLRYPVGPDAAGSIGWRTGMSDEEWIDWNAADDDAWYEAVRRDFGLDARSAD
jgi:NAD(P)-dependent dehydrogenase (short-subunit alcohol dehydrogenase family)